MAYLQSRIPHYAHQQLPTTRPHHRIEQTREEILQQIASTANEQLVWAYRTPLSKIQKNNRDILNPEPNLNYSIDMQRRNTQSR